ncbi:MAG: methionyl-tRNA formyltransferase [Bacteroidales bacterium]|nr:methionyl-tRNA formyltransferase [Bacteroidales bacterium]
MNPKDLRLVFMGTPALAAFSLRKLHEGGYNVVGVVTAPDKPAGRGLKLQPSEVKKYATEKNIPVLQPEKLKSPEFLEQLKSLAPDVQVVVAFRMLPEAVWSLPEKGTFNMHASLLPQYRGAAPINWAIINGEKETGVTTFLLDREIDTGKILFQERLDIFENETAGSLHDRIMVVGADLVLKTIDALALNQVEPLDQSALIAETSQLKKAPKIFKEDCLIDWKKPCHEVANHIHGMSPFPGAFTVIEVDKREIILKIFEAEAREMTHSYNYGEIFSDGKSILALATPDGIVEVKSLQMAGKKRMSTSDFLRGFRLDDRNNMPN